MTDGFTVKEIVQQIYTKQETMDDKIDKIHSQVKLTNSRVTSLEKRSIGMWIGDNPLKFASLLIVVITVLLTESRTFLIGSFFKVIGI